MIEKQAATDYPIHELLSKRWSPLAFADRLVEGEKILSLLEAARWAPSCFNEQPWSFMIATKDNPDEFEKLLSCLVDANQTWAKHAPLLMLSVASLNFARNGKPNRHAFHDVGLAVGNLIMQASSMGLYVHQMGGFHLDKARALYQIPESYEPVAAIAMGYPGEADSLPEDLQQRELAPGTRKSLKEFLYSGLWDQTAPFVTTK